MLTCVQGLARAVDSDELVAKATRTATTCITPAGCMHLSGCGSILSLPESIGGGEVQVRWMHRSPCEWTVRIDR
jgi:hypothetical protein